MNRLIIVGNGFDLAHGLDTRYSDFMLNLIIREIKKGYHNRKAESDFFIVECYNSFGDSRDLERFLSSLKSLNDVFTNDHINNNLKDSFKPGKNTLFKFTVKSTFVHRLLMKYDIHRWVDIESEYFNYLHEIGTVINNGPISRSDAMINLNKDLKLLSKNLKDYLQNVNDNYNFESTTKSNEIFQSKIRELLFSNIINSSGTIGNQYECLIVNYNYTNTVSNYLRLNPYNYPTDIINLHGTLENNDLIFGYGHVEGDEYTRLEKLRINEALKSLKLFNYHMKGEYRKLIDFLQKDEFDVFVLGHSCGASDGTTMRRIFDSPNCRKINICHIGSDEYQTKTMDIKRHCLSEVVHDKIQPFDVKLEFPNLIKA